MEPRVSDALGRYLDVRYSAQARPYTSYPDALCAYLGEHHLPSRGRLLDLGSGRGEFLHGFRTLGFEVMGVDRALPQDRRFVEPVKVADFERDGLPFADDSFEVVFNKSVLEHVTDVTRVLDECRRVLGYGAGLVFLYHLFDWRYLGPQEAVGTGEAAQASLRPTLRSELVQYYGDAVERRWRLGFEMRF